ncbi:hypothetical protein WICPIJ_005782 [Wickerhamomyces pijperi]|uniref:SWR1-complex protein 5 n=1 Tax=Wickerhamomyces pijperi TaxID=599730 RepID=A0A9P8TLL5_WICPI|nr:hypothetical protein WICPIJ_005782 [Wickerhamomyces pijperi]
MNSMDTKERPAEEVEEDHYVEEEDEDFDPNGKYRVHRYSPATNTKDLLTFNPTANNGNDEDFSESDEDEADSKPKTKKRKLEEEKAKRETEKEVSNANYKSIESSEGGLIKTRSQRQQESQESKQFRHINNGSTASSTTNIDELWEKLKKESTQRLKHQFSSSNVSSDSSKTALNSNRKVKIKRKYEYAGEIITEEKWVDAESAEAKAYISTLQDRSELETNEADGPTSDKTEAEAEAEEDKARVNERGEKLRKVYKRPPLLEGIINGSIKPKFNTLEKSRVDFAKFVDKEGINDELTQHNKNGYLEKQDFLSRVEFHRDSSIKEMRKKELMNKNNK